ncbi:hypothetical protein [uncultured Maricaulis sp.]|uniref:hypothetical protein n=1 Tax=uncultured Maricaulis sp. TaxID=174710 RepID=UPI0030DB3390
MSRTARHSGSLIKSAMLWLTVAVMLASVYGAVLAAAPDPRPRNLFADTQPAPMITASNEFAGENADR